MSRRLRAGPASARASPSRCTKTPSVAPAITSSSMASDSPHATTFPAPSNAVIRIDLGVRLGVVAQVDRRLRRPAARGTSGGHAAVLRDGVDVDRRRRRGPREGIVDREDLERSLVGGLFAAICREQGEGHEARDSGGRGDRAGPHRPTLTTAPCYRNGAVEPVVREIAVPPDVDALARALRGERGVAVLRSDPRGAVRPSDAAASFLACDPVEESSAWVPAQVNEANEANGARERRAGGTDARRRRAGWGSCRTRRRAGSSAPAWTRAPDDRPRAMFARPTWLRYDAVLRVDHASGRVAIEADDARAAERLAARVAASDARRARVRRATAPPLGARRGARRARPRGARANRRGRRLPGERGAGDRSRAPLGRSARRLPRALPSARPPPTASSRTSGTPAYARRAPSWRSRSEGTSSARPQSRGPVPAAATRAPTAPSRGRSTATRKSAPS